MSLAEILEATEPDEFEQDGITYERCLDPDCAKWNADGPWWSHYHRSTP